jgi:hypothetical protein
VSGQGDERERWRCSWWVASVWWCGDDYCDCTQPIVELVEPNFRAGYPWVKRERHWEGTFETDGEGDSEVWRRELAEVAPRFHLKLADDGLSGRGPYVGDPATTTAKRSSPESTACKSCPCVSSEGATKA